MRKTHGEGHPLRRVIGCKTEHQPLVARAHVGSIIDSLGNVRRLFSDEIENGQTVRVKPARTVRISDLADGFDCHFLDVHLRL